MEQNANKVIAQTAQTTCHSNGTSTENKKPLESKESENLINFTNNTFDSEESLGIISIKSEDLGSYIDNLQLKESKKDRISYAKEQRALASKALHNRESKISSLPSRFLRPSEVSSTYDSFSNIYNGSTISESDLLKQTGIDNTSTPRSSISLLESKPKIDVAESMAKMSLEMRNPSMSLSSAIQKMEQEYTKIRDSLSVQSHMFKPAEEAESQLLADEFSWKKEKDLPVQRADFTAGNIDASQMSISTFFRQRSEDLSNIIPGLGKDSSVTAISDIMSASSRKSSISSIPANMSSLLENCNPLKKDDSLSITKIAQILQESEDTPTKVLDYLMKQCPSRETLNRDLQSSNSYDVGDVKQSNRRNIHSSYTLSQKTNEDSGNFDPSTLTSDKENFNSLNVPHESNLGKVSSNISKSVSSLRSSSSLSNLPGGKLPIGTTHAELVWGCVKIGKYESNEFTLRNRTSSRLSLQCSITGPSFKIVQERAENSSNSTKLMLHAHETKSVTVIFNPFTDGAAVDEILFSPCDPNLQQLKKQSIRLFGYGGTGNIEFKNNIFKDSAGRHWFTLGDIFGKSVVTQTMTVFNKGTLPAFAFFDYTPKDIAFLDVTVSPINIVLAPKEEMDITITCKASSEDFKYLKNCMTTSVFETGMMKIISGPEATRGRIRRICRIAAERNLELDNLSFQLQQEIPGEAIPADVVKCRESLNSLKPLLKGLSQKEVVITLEKDLDHTLVSTITDDTSMFQSLCNETVIAKSNTKFKLEPSSLILTPPSKLRDYLFLVSENDCSLKYEIWVPEGVEVNPNSGYLKPHVTKVIEIKIKCLADIAHSRFSVKVNVEGDVFRTDVKIIFI